MKHIMFFAAMAVSAVAWAQAPKPEPIKAEPIKAEAAKPQPETAPAAKKAAKPAAAMAKKNSHSRRSEDARQCLERPTNDEIIRCAEEYL